MRPGAQPRAPTVVEHLPLTVLPGVGPGVATRLRRLGLETVQDLLFHLPTRFQDRTRVTPLGALAAGQDAVVVGKVEASQVAFGRRRSLLAHVSDGTGSVVVRLFHFSRSQERALAARPWIRCFGQARPGPRSLELVHPEYQLFDSPPDGAGDETLTPIYPATEGVTQRLLRRLVAAALERCQSDLVDHLPAAVAAEQGFDPLGSSLQTLHRPTPGEGSDARRARARARLAFEELLAHHLALRRLRERRQTLGAPALDAPGRLREAFEAALPFELTGAQRRATAEVLADLAGSLPSLRLVQGDVGSGKTVVAAMAAAQAIESGFKAVLMAPTELLAEQHHHTLAGWLEPLGVEVLWLAGSTPRRERTRVLARLTAPGPCLVVGTHALFQESVDFAGVGLVVVDEQHRFGVDQRLALRAKGSDATRVPHQVVMTATPIPRSLAMTFYADLDLTSIDELPPNRKPVETVAVSESRRAEVVERVRRACAGGRQAYWVCPLIDESDSMDARSAVATEATLRDALPGLATGLVHGRMKPRDKDDVMRRFRAGEIAVLVATTVIEVGVDVPNASLMIIENAERLGLSQLHQLRGRVGRGDDAACCVLVYRRPVGSMARERLSTMRSTTDGFEIAAKDLEQRGPGEVLGTRQTGDQLFRVANLVADQAMIPAVERAARTLAADRPERIGALVARWTGAGSDYGDV